MTSKTPMAWRKPINRILRAIFGLELCTIHTGDGEVIGLGIRLEPTLWQDAPHPRLQPKPDDDRRPTVVLDFDGVVHSYASGWKGPEIIPDDPTPNAVEFCEAAVTVFDVCIVSTRCTYSTGPLAICGWLDRFGFPSSVRVSPDGKKEPAIVTLDDRALMFNGKFPSLDLLRTFTPWNRDPRKPVPEDVKEERNLFDLLERIAHPHLY